MLDRPIVGLINEWNKVSCCFTLQSCYGHFVYQGQNDIYNIDPLPVKDTLFKVEYRIAYIAFCLENSSLGRKMLNSLKEVMTIDPEYVQFFCAEWFWETQLNSYVLQVEPDRFKHKDTAIIDSHEAMHIEKIRNEFFVQLYELVARSNSI